MRRFVLFDLDGTLIDTTHLILEAYRHTVRTHLGYTPRDEQVLPGFGTPSHLQMRQFSPDPTQVEAMLVTFRAFNLERHDELTQPVPDVPGVLKDLADRGYVMGLVTSKIRRMAFKGLDLFDLARYMSLVVAMEDVAVHKPDPAPILQALSLLGARADETLYVGDSVHDVAAGRAAAVCVAAALWGPFPREALEEAGPDYLLNSMRDLLELCPPLNRRESREQELAGQT